MTFVYRYYDQAELERQLNARATVPDIAPILARYASESARMRTGLACRLGISYGASEPERLDIFPAATREPASIFVFLHGGYWRLLDSADSCFMAECLTRAGASPARSRRAGTGSNLDCAMRSCAAMARRCCSSKPTSASRSSATRRGSPRSTAATPTPGSKGQPALH